MILIMIRFPKFQVQERKGRTLTVEEVQEVVRQGASQFPKDRRAITFYICQILEHQPSQMPWKCLQMSSCEFFTVDVPSQVKQASRP